MALEKHSDGSWRDPRGFVAVVMQRTSFTEGNPPHTNIFNFVAGHFEPPHTVRWPIDAEATLVDPSVINTMITEGYARHLTDEEAANATLEVEEVEEVDDEGDEGDDTGDTGDTGDQSNAGAQGAGKKAPAATPAAKKAAATPAPAADGEKPPKVASALTAAAEQLEAKKKAAASPENT